MRATLKFLVLSTAVIGWLSVASHRADAVVTITIGTNNGMPGDTVPVDVTMTTGGATVAGTQNDITLPDGLSIGEDDEGNPDCAVNPDIRKSATSFAYLPAGCTPGTNCTGVRAIVLSLTNVTPIPDGSRLYTCQITIADDADSGDLVLDNTNTNSSDPGGVMLETTGVAGTVTVEGGTSKPVTIHIGSGSGSAGGTATFDVTLESTVDVAGTQNDIGFAGPISIPENDEGNPDCTVNPDIRKSATSFAYLPAGCTPGTNCTGIRAIVLSLTNVTVIPTGSRLYTCTVAIAAGASGSHDLVCANPNASDPGGVMLDTGCTNGSISVGGEGTPTSTATGGGGATPTNTVAGPTNTSTSVPGTPTATRPGGTATATKTTGGGVFTPTSKPTARILDDDGCAVTSPGDTSAGWMLLLPAAMLLWVRRRTR